MDAASKVQLEAAISAAELRFERRVGALEADLRELKAGAVTRTGPLVDELHDFEQRMISLEGELRQVKSKNGMLGRAEVVEIARQVTADLISGGRSTSDYMMRVAMFGISLGTLIFVVKGGT